MPPPPRHPNPTQPPSRLANQPVIWSKPAFTPQNLRPVDEKPFKHTRGYSHDSVIDGGQSGAHVPSRSPIDTERRPGQYFRRLSSLPEHKRSSLSSASVSEAARGILYSMSTLGQPIEQYITSKGDPGGPESKVGRALYNSKMHMNSLVSALESYEARDDESAVQKVIDACQSCVAAFRQVLSMLQSSLREHGPGASGADVRFARTLVLMAYGSYVEIQCSYETLRPLLLAHAIFDDSKSRTGSLTISRNQSVVNPYNRQNSISNQSIVDVGPPGMFIPPALGTPRNVDASFAIHPSLGAHPLQHSDPGFNQGQEDALYQKFQAAITAALSFLPQVDREIKASGSVNMQPPVALKLREVSSLCTSGCEAARRLSKIRWDLIQDGDLSERKKFWDESNKLIQVCLSGDALEVPRLTISAAHHKYRRIDKVNCSRIYLF